MWLTVRPWTRLSKNPHECADAGADGTLVAEMMRVRSFHQNSTAWEMQLRRVSSERRAGGPADCESDSFLEVRRVEE